MSRLCPDFDEKGNDEASQNHFKIRNGYINRADRASFTIQIDVCNQEQIEFGEQVVECVDKTAINRLLSKVFFTVYYTKGYVIF